VCRWHDKPHAHAKGKDRGGARFVIRAGWEAAVAVRRRHSSHLALHGFGWLWPHLDGKKGLTYQ